MAVDDDDELTKLPSLLVYLNTVCFFSKYGNVFIYYFAVETD